MTPPSIPVASLHALVAQWRAREEELRRKADECLFGLNGERLATKADGFAACATALSALLDHQPPADEQTETRVDDAQHERKDK